MKARELIASALRLIGVLGPGETPSAEDANDALTVLNQLLESWSISGLLVWAPTEEIVTLTSGTAGYTWGTGGDIATARPVEIQEAFIRESGIDYPVDIIDMDQYRLIGLKSTTGRPDRLAYTPEYPFGKIYLYPTPDAAHALHTRTLKEITALTSLDTDISWPPGYERAIKYDLGADLAPEYGKSLDQVFAYQGKQAMAAIMRRNVKPKKRPVGACHRTAIQHHGGVMTRIEIPFNGQTYQGASRAYANEICRNWYPEKTPAGKWVLLPTPGMTERVDLGSSASIRGLIAAGDYLYAVTGTDFYQVDSDWIATDKGNVSGTSRVSMAWNGTQVLIVNGTTGYTYTPGTDTFAEISSGGFPANPEMCAFKDSYFIVNDSGTGNFYISDNYDGTTWSALDVATAESFPDCVTAVGVDADLILGGPQSIEAWYNSGAASFPFARRTIIKTGIAAPFSLAAGDNGFFWLARDDRGQGLVMAAYGYQGQVISTPAVSYQISRYGTISDAFGFIFQMGGHLFYALTFPTEDATWVYDVSTGQWFEWSSYNTASEFSASWGRHRSNCYAYFNGSHVVGDYENGKLYSLEPDVYTDAGTQLRRVRRSQTISNNQDRVFFHSLLVRFEPGVGLDSGQGLGPAGNASIQQ